MTKTVKNKKKSKSKIKKLPAKSTSGSSGSSKSKNFSGAPKTNPDVKSQTQQHASSNYTSLSDKKFEKLLKKCLKVNHLKHEDKAVRKAKRSIRKLKKNGSTIEDIQKAEAILQQAVLDKKEAEACLDPKAVIEKLTTLLEEQIRAKAPNEQIQETSQLLEKAKTSYE